MSSVDERSTTIPQDCSTIPMAATRRGESRFFSSEIEEMKMKPVFQTGQALGKLPICSAVLRGEHAEEEVRAQNRLLACGHRVLERRNISQQSLQRSEQGGCVGESTRKIDGSKPVPNRAIYPGIRGLA